MKKIVQTLTESSEQIVLALAAFTEDTKKAEQMEEPLETARYYHDSILKDMDTLRASVDQAEAIIPGSYLPYPTYDELLFSPIAALVPPDTIFFYRRQRSPRIFAATPLHPLLRQFLTSSSIPIHKFV